MIQIPWNKGKKLPPRTEEWKRKISEAMKGHKCSKSTRKKIGEANKDRKFSEEHINKIRKSKTGKIGKKAFHWKRGKYKGDNRWWIYQPNHPFATQKGYIRQSRLVAEKCLGRYLTPKEVIHHINEIKSDDRPKNLYLFSCQVKHARFHKLKNKPKLKSNLIS